LRKLLLPKEVHLSISTNMRTRCSISWRESARYDAVTRLKATKGSLAILPRKIPHGFRNIGSTPSKILVTITPGGFERFFEEASKLPTDRPPDMEKVMAMAQKYSLELLPPSQGG
jgi:hypothetical protein